MNIKRHITKAKNHAKKELESGNNIAAAGFIGGVLRYYSAYPERFNSEDVKKDIDDLLSIGNLNVLRISKDELVAESEWALKYLNRFKCHGFDTPEECVQILTLCETIEDINHIATLNGIEIGHARVAKEITEDILNDKGARRKIEAGIKKNNPFYLPI